MSDHQMGWPVKDKGEIKLELKYQMTETSKGSPYEQGYSGQQVGTALGYGKSLYADDPAKARQWTMGWGASYADHGPASRRFATGGIVSPGAVDDIIRRVNAGGFTGPRGVEHMGAEAIMPLVRPDDTGQFCVIAQYGGRNWYDSLDKAVAHGAKLLKKPGQQASKLIIAKAARIVEHEEPPHRVRMPRKGEFA